MIVSTRNDSVRMSGQIGGLCIEVASAAWDARERVPDLWDIRKP